MAAQSKPQLHLYLSTQERELLANQAKAQNMTLSRYVRSLADHTWMMKVERFQTAQQCTRQLTSCLMGLRSEIPADGTSAEQFAEAIALLGQIEQALAP